MKSCLNGLHGSPTSLRGTLTEDFLASVHVDHGRLRMMSRVEQGNAFVDGMLDDFIGLTGFPRGLFAITGNQYGVNYVNDAIRGLDVRLDHLGLVDQEGLARWLDRELGAIDGFRRIELGGLLGLHLAGHYVVGEDSSQLLLVFRLQQGFNRSLGELGEGLVGGSEDREGTFSLERVHKTGCLDGGNKGLKATRPYGRVDDVFFWRRRGERTDYDE